MSAVTESGLGQLLTDSGAAVPVRYRLEAEEENVHHETLAGSSTRFPGLRRFVVTLIVRDATELGRSIQVDVVVRLALENGDEIEGTIKSQDQSSVEFEAAKKGHIQAEEHFGLEPIQ